MHRLYRYRNRNYKKLRKENNELCLAIGKSIQPRSLQISPQRGSVWQLVNQHVAPKDRFPSKAFSCRDKLQFSSICWNWAKREQAFLPEWLVETGRVTIYLLLSRLSWGNLSTSKWGLNWAPRRNGRHVADQWNHAGKCQQHDTLSASCAAAR